MKSCHEFISYRYDNVKKTADWKNLSKVTRGILRNIRKSGVWKDESGIQVMELKSLLDSLLTKLSKEIKLLKFVRI